jgi:mycothiol synthase
LISVRRPETDAELEGWIRVRRIVYPNESAWTVQDFRERDWGEQLFLIAELDGEIVGNGMADRSDIGTRGFASARVVPDARRRGVGTALLRELVAHVEALALDKVATMVEDEGSRAFAERFGFQEVNRQVEQVRLLSEVPEAPPPPNGIEVTTIAESPELLREAHPLAVEGYADMATDGTATISLEDWLRDEATYPAGSFVALAGGEVVGFSGLVRHDNEGVAEDGLTVVRRDWRRRGLAHALKARELAWAAENGLREVVTWTQTGNEGMRALNERLGYEYRDVSVTMLAPLPLQNLNSGPVSDTGEEPRSRVLRPPGV